MHTKSFHADEYLDRDVWYGITHGTLCSEDQLQEFVCSQGFTSMHSVRQVHGSTVVNAHSSCNGDEADAIVSYDGGVVLSIRVADCCGIVLYHPHESVYACIHSGWRGTKTNIVARTIERIVQDTGIDPSLFRSWLSACASGEAYVVRSDVQQYFPGFCSPIDGDQFLFDNRKALRSQLRECGVLESSITASPSCTIQESRFHSYRRDGVNSGRNVVFVGRH